MLPGAVSISPVFFLNPERPVTIYLVSKKMMFYLQYGEVCCYNICVYLHRKYQWLIK